MQKSIDSRGHFIKYYQANVFDELMMKILPDSKSFKPIERAYFQHCAYLIEQHDKMSLYQTKMASLYGITRVSVQAIENKIEDNGLLTKSFERSNNATYRILKFTPKGVDFYRKLRESPDAKYSLVNIGGNVKRDLNWTLIKSFIGFSKNVIDLSNMVGITRRSVDSSLKSNNRSYLEFQSDVLNDIFSNSGGDFMG